MDEQGHNYEVIELSNINGFKVVPRDTSRGEVTVSLNEYGFWTINSYQNNQRYYRDNRCIPLYGFREMIDSTINYLYDSWVSPKLTYISNKQRSSHKVANKIKMWAKNRTGKSLNPIIHAQWEKGVNSVSPIVNQLHKACFSTIPFTGCYINIEDVIKENDKYLISDLLKYKAARVVLLNSRSKYQFNEWKKDWMLEYSCNGTKYHALTSTLMNMPAGISYSATLTSLKIFVLPEPAKTRLRLMAYTELAPKFGYNRASNAGVILRSTDEDIYNAIRMIWNAFPARERYYRGQFITQTSDFRKPYAINSALSIIFDYIGNWDNLDIMGLARRSIQFHQNEELRRQMEQNERLAIQNVRRQMCTAKPKIDLPQDEHIKFLGTFEDVEQEGQIMKHCIASYASKAVDGKCYLFHVDYNNEMASVEVLPSGVVSQSYGPHDTHNSASEYGERVLRKWAQQLVRGQ